MLRLFPTGIIFVCAMSISRKGRSHLKQLLHRLLRWANKIRLDDKEGTLIGTCVIGNTGGPESWKDFPGSG